MPAVPFDTLPDDARLWVFATAPLDAPAERALLDATDDFLAGWAAHGVPLSAARDWRDGRFLAVAIDQRVEGASGCSIDGLFRRLQSLGSTLGTGVLAAGQIFWRDADGQIRSGDRAAFRAVASAGGVGPDTPVFDTTVATAGAWRTRFELPLGESWHARLLVPAAATARG